MYITESSNASWAGFYVRVPNAPSKLFPYSLGKRKAKALAVAYRDRMVLKTKPGRPYSKKKRSARNRSGVIGVFRFVRVRRVNGTLYRHAYWIAQWGTTGREQFSERIYGQKEARRLAVKVRKAAVAHGAAS